MQIRDGWTLHDEVSGLKITAVKGEHMNRLHIERVGEALADNRDFFFLHDGTFDGTGSAIPDPP